MPVQRNYHLIADLSKCDTQALKNKEGIKALIRDIIKLAKMKPLGNVIIEEQVRSQHDGITAIQIIKTSNIAIHCFNKSKSVFIDLHSCKKFDWEPIAALCIRHFRCPVDSRYFKINFFMR